MIKQMDRQIYCRGPEVHILLGDEIAILEFQRKAGSAFDAPYGVCRYEPNFCIARGSERSLRLLGWLVPGFR
jgi:hypothetical protein